MAWYTTTTKGPKLPYLTHSTRGKIYPNNFFRNSFFCIPDSLSLLVTTWLHNLPKLNISKHCPHQTTTHSPYWVLHCPLTKLYSTIKNTSPKYTPLNIHVTVTPYLNIIHCYPMTGKPLPQFIHTSLLLTSEQPSTLKLFYLCLYIYDKNMMISPPTVAE